MVNTLMGICLMFLVASMIQGDNGKSSTNNTSSSTNKQPKQKKEEFSIWAKENDYSFESVREQLSLRYFSGEVDEIARRLRTDYDYRHRVERAMELYDCTLQEAIDRVDD